MYRIDHCVAGCMTIYLPWEKVSPLEASEVPRPRTSSASAGDNFSQSS